MNEIFQTTTFSKLYDASQKKEQIWIEKIKDQLVENLTVSKPLHYSWFREKKFENKRLYYVINEKKQGNINCIW